MQRLNAIDLFTMIFIIMGGLNMGVIGIFNIDVISYLLGEQSIFSRILHIVIGLSAVYVFILTFILRRK